MIFFQFNHCRRLSKLQIQSKYSTNECQFQLIFQFEKNVVFAFSISFHAETNKFQQKDDHPNTPGDEGKLGPFDAPFGCSILVTKSNENVLKMKHTQKQSKKKQNVQNIGRKNISKQKQCKFSIACWKWTSFLHRKYFIFESIQFKTKSHRLDLWTRC